MYGTGDGSFQTITDPQDGNPVFYVSEQTRNVTISNLQILGGSNSGPAIDSRADDGGPNARLWEIYRVEVIGGPIIMLGPRNQLRHVTVDMVSEREYDVKSLNHTTKAALSMNGATCGIMGGSYSNKNDSDEAVFFSGAAGSITGGVTISNAGGERDGTKRDLTLVGCGRMMIGPCSFEGAKTYQLQFGSEEINTHPPGLKNSVLFGSAFNPTSGDIDGYDNYSKIRCEGGYSRNWTIINPLGNVVFDISTDSNPNVGGLVISSNKVEAFGNRSQYITHIQPKEGKYRIGGDRDSPSTQVGISIDDSPPQFPEQAAFLIADGTGWDPAGNGNAALVTYDMDGNWKPVFEYSDSF